MLEWACDGGEGRQIQCVVSSGFTGRGMFNFFKVNPTSGGGLEKFDSSGNMHCHVNRVFEFDLSDYDQAALRGQQS